MSLRTVPNSEPRRAVLDTYAWIEYFRGSAEGSAVSKYLEKGFQPFTPSIVIAELSDKYRREGINEWPVRRSFIKLKSKILHLDELTADRAGELKQTLRKKFKDAGLADAIVWAHSLQNDALVVTGDKHLREMENAVNLKKVPEV